METKEPDKATRIVVLTFEDIVVGLIVDAVYDVLRIPKEDIGPTPSVLSASGEAHYVSGVAKVGERLIIIMDVKGLLTKKEIESVEQIEVQDTQK
jgi:purine-binding chemotaxis protein CheW